MIQMHNITLGSTNNATKINWMKFESHHANHQFSGVKMQFSMTEVNFWYWQDRWIAPSVTTVLL